MKKLILTLTLSMLATSALGAVSANRSPLQAAAVHYCRAGAHMTTRLCQDILKTGAANLPQKQGEVLIVAAFSKIPAPGRQSLAKADPEFVSLIDSSHASLKAFYSKDGLDVILVQGGLVIDKTRLAERAQKQLQQMVGE